MSLLPKGFFFDVFHFWRIWGWFWSPKWIQKLNFGIFVCSMFFSSAFWHRCWVFFLSLRTLKICTSTEREHNFYKIDVCEQVTKKNSYVGCVFGSRNDEKSRNNGVEKHVFFNIGFWAHFFRIFRDLQSPLSGEKKRRGRAAFFSSPENKYIWREEERALKSDEISSVARHATSTAAQPPAGERRSAGGALRVELRWTFGEPWANPGRTLGEPTLFP